MICPEQENFGKEAKLTNGQRECEYMKLAEHVENFIVHLLLSNKRYTEISHACDKQGSPGNNRYQPNESSEFMTFCN